jgi:glucose/mannose-6-phosphate isomerase
MAIGVDLDNQAIYTENDPEGMLTHLHNFPDMCRRVWKQVLDFNIPQDYEIVKNIIILGMGGSAIGGDLVRSLLVQQAKIPIFISRDYDLPSFADTNSLIIVSSYSGATEETLSAFQQALKIDCPKVAITTGGKLKELCQSQGIPIFNIDYKSQPRAALPYGLYAILGILTRLRIVSEKTLDISESFRSLEELSAKIGQDIPVGRNQAKSLALALSGKLVIIYGGEITQEVARRWKTQINENAKGAAFYEYFPELNHNSVVGYDFPRWLAGRTSVVMLASNLLNKRILLRYRITRELLEKTGIACHTVQGEGSGALSQMMTLILFGDYVSYYLALLNGVDPTPVEVISFLKNELQQA